MPEAQAEQEEAPPVENVLAGQVEQLDALGPLYVPPGQVAQAPLLMYFPAGQLTGAQLVDP